MGLGKVSSWSRGSKVSVWLKITLSRPQDLIVIEEKNEKRGMKNIPSKKNDVFHVEKYLTRKILGLGLGLCLEF